MCNARLRTISQTKAKLYFQRATAATGAAKDYGAGARVGELGGGGFEELFGGAVGDGEVDRRGARILGAEDWLQTGADGAEGRGVSDGERQVERGGPSGSALP